LRRPGNPLAARWEGGWVPFNQLAGIKRWPARGRQPCDSKCSIRTDAAGVAVIFFTSWVVMLMILRTIGGYAPSSSSYGPPTMLIVRLFGSEICYGRVREVVALPRDLFHSYVLETGNEELHSSAIPISQLLDVRA